MKIFKVTQTFSPDHKNIIDIAKPSVGIKRGIFQSIRFESTKKKVGKRTTGFSLQKESALCVLHVYILHERVGKNLN